MKLVGRFFGIFIAVILTLLFVRCSDDDNLSTKEGVLNFSTAYDREGNAQNPLVTDEAGAVNTQFSFEAKDVYGYNKNEIIKNFKLNTSAFSFEFVSKDNPDAAKVKTIILDLSLDERTEHYHIEVANTASVTMEDGTYKGLSYDLFNDLFRKGARALKVEAQMLDAEEKVVPNVKFNIVMKANLDLYVVWNENNK